MHCTAITYVKKLWVIDVDVITIILFFVCCRMLYWIFLYLQRWRCRRQIVYTYANNTSTSSFSSVICSGFQFSWFFGCLRFILLSVELDFFDMAACRGLHWIVCSVLAVLVEMITSCETISWNLTSAYTKTHYSIDLVVCFSWVIECFV